MTGPLAGVKIVDMSAVIAGPMATGLLADQGAEVVKVEPVGIGDMCRWLGPNHKGLGAMFAAVNRNKRSIALNLKDARGKQILLDLTEHPEQYLQYGNNARAHYGANRTPQKMIEGFLAAIDYAANRANERRERR